MAINQLSNFYANLPRHTVHTVCLNSTAEVNISFNNPKEYSRRSSSANTSEITDFPVEMNELPVDSELCGNEMLASK